MKIIFNYHNILLLKGNYITHLLFWECMSGYHEEPFGLLLELWSFSEYSLCQWPSKLVLPHDSLPIRRGAGTACDNNVHIHHQCVNETDKRYQKGEAQSKWLPYPLHMCYRLTIIIVIMLVILPSVLQFLCSKPYFGEYYHNGVWGKWVW